MAPLPQRTKHLARPRHLCFLGGNAMGMGCDVERGILMKIFGLGAEHFPGASSQTPAWVCMEGTATQDMLRFSWCSVMWPRSWPFSLNPELALFLLLSRRDVLTESLVCILSCYDMVLTVSQNALSSANSITNCMMLQKWRDPGLLK